MSTGIDKLMMAMSLEEEDDEPFDIPNLPEYYSSEKKNSMSIIGRVLNPDRQKMKSLILDMPRIWKLHDRVRGVALSKEKFQFFFKYEQDLEEILSKAVWSYKEWTIVIDRWVQNPPHDYLQFLPVWVHIRNIPVNHYTSATVKALGKIIGKVLEVGFDSTKPQPREYVRVRVRFDVSKPLRRSKVVNFPSCGSVTISYEFEKFHKRCFFCQRLSHVREKCPLYIASLSKEPQAVLSESDPLFGVLSEYLVTPEGVERKIREERVGKSIDDLKNDPFGNDQKLLASPIQAGSGVCNFSRESSYSLFEGDGVNFSLYSMPFQACSTGSRDGFHEATSTGTVLKKKNPRRRPCKSKRDLKGKEKDAVDAVVIVKL